MLLVVIGDCMMEAMGHSKLHMWWTSIKYNVSSVYNYLTLFAMVSFFLRQLAMCFHITNTLEDTQEFEASNDNHMIKVNIEDSNP